MKEMRSAIKKSDVLIEALPYIKKFFEKVVVIKYGGSVIGEKGGDTGILQDIVFMSYAGMRPVIVHGGGPLISKAMKNSGKLPEFVMGFRVTDKETVSIVDTVLRGVNKRIVRSVEKVGGKAFGLSGKENNMVRARKVRTDVDLGFVGEAVSIDTTVVKRLVETDVIPVIYPMGIARNGDILNVNADDVASKIAVALKAEKFVLLTDVRGILKNTRDPSSIYHSISIERIRELIHKGEIKGGMIPKADSCANAVRGGVKKAHILDASISHAMLLEIFTDKGIGTEIVK
ncbi:MAG: acetylglutamate kinase [Candidatus Omnitrophota bacterium]